MSLRLRMVTGENPVRAFFSRGFLGLLKQSERDSESTE